jgi:hypothetical protein
MSGADLDGLDYLLQIDSVAFGEERPFIHEGKNGSPIAVLDNLRRFRFDRAIQNREGNFSVFKTSFRNFVTRFLASSFTPLQTRQKSRIEAT